MIRSLNCDNAKVQSQSHAILTSKYIFCNVHCPIEMYRFIMLLLQLLYVHYWLSFWNQTMWAENDSYSIAVSFQTWVVWNLGTQNLLFLQLTLDNIRTTVDKYLIQIPVYHSSPYFSKTKVLSAHNAYTCIITQSIAEVLSSFKTKYMSDERQNLFFRFWNCMKLELQKLLHS